MAEQAAQNSAKSSAGSVGRPSPERPLRGGRRFRAQDGFFVFGVASGPPRSGNDASSRSRYAAANVAASLCVRLHRGARVRNAPPAQRFFQRSERWQSGRMRRSETCSAAACGSVPFRWRARSGCGSRSPTVPRPWSCVGHGVRQAGAGCRPSRRCDRGARWHALLAERRPSSAAAAPGRTSPSVPYATRRTADHLQRVSPFGNEAIQLRTD